MPNKITLQRIDHRNAERILLKPAERLPKEDFMIYTQKVKQVEGCAYSHTHKGYYVPCTMEAFNALEKLLGAENLVYEKKKPQNDDDTQHGKAPGKQDAPQSDDTADNRQTSTLNLTGRGINKDAKADIHMTTPEAPTLPVVVLQPVFVGKSERILFTGDYPKRLDNLVLKKVPGARYSDSHKSWHVPLNDAVYEIIKEKTTGLALLKLDDLREYLYRRNHIKKSAPVPVSPQTTAERTWQSQKISTENLNALERLVQQLVLEGLSPSTIKTYRSEFVQFLKWAGQRPVSEMEPEHLRSYMEYCLKELGISEHTAHSRLNALKAYFEKVLHKDKFFHELPRPKKPQSLPKVLSEEELGRLFSGIKEKRDKAILFTAYSAGLRISEVVGLRKEDIDHDRMELFIYRAKGKKDRIVTLSPLVSDILKKHLETVTPKPLKYVFEGKIPGQRLSKNTAGDAFREAKNASEILKSVTFHSLRHSFATHMLEKGVSTRYIQEILGHFSIKTTERYLHVARTKLINLPSPIDELWQKGGFEI